MAKISPTKVKTEISQHKDGCYIAQRDMRAFVLAGIRVKSTLVLRTFVITRNVVNFGCKRTGFRWF